MDTILRVAGELIGTALSDPVDLGGSARSRVLRCRTESGGSVVVKAYAEGPAARRGFAAEAAGLSLRLAGPRLLATHSDTPLLVMEDLGAAPSLADVLLGGDPRAAADGLLIWARTLGKLAAESVRRRESLTRLWTQHGGDTMSWQTRRWVDVGATALRDALTAAGIPAPDGLAGELAGLGQDLHDAYPAFTPGDTCLDNNLLTVEGLRLIDFEGACFAPVFLTAAYCRMPFPSCWCVFRLPAGLATEIEQAFREQVTEAYPALADDAVWEKGVARAVAAWTLEVTEWLLPLTAQDEPLHSTRPAPTPRQVLRHRWEAAAAIAEFPALARSMRLLLNNVAATWDASPLPEYPAFRPLRPHT
ncbi:hypothetical protein KDK95_27590 [Actinospica sp. MGRD01-02]|uniref:Aminoglycoside phosphotransferase domain-containing protein n=1 Tax=Actinospica acidithermotolerans TaxID=2828514 RepID=A0A941ILK2_9ACTN|nr:hypothetical protein [Actinospica acidithermotolerans]MBR7830097.1 hypothetical protein [Actinospica acidithermotolerans]